jgi:hypothetical protein
MATQAKMPGVMPTPAQARSVLRLSRDDVAAKRATVRAMRAQAQAAKDAEAAALADLEEAEGDGLASDDGTEAAVSAEQRQTKEWKRAKKARDSREKVARTLRLARSELKEAEARLAAARDDIEALQEGRRSK